MEYPFYGCKMKQVNARNNNKKNSVLSVRVIDSAWHVYRALTSWPVMLRRQNILSVGRETHSVSYPVTIHLLVNRKCAGDKSRKSKYRNNFSILHSF